MNKFNKIVTGFALGVLVLLTIAAAIDYRSLNTNQFSNVSTVSIVTTVPLTNALLYTTTSGGKRVLVSGSQALLDDAERFSILWGDRTWVDASGLVGSGNYGARYLTNAAGGEFLNWNTGNITGVVNNVTGSLLRTNAILSVTISGGGSVIVPGVVQGFPSSGDNWTITGWSISCMGTSPTISCDIWSVAPGGTALPTSANTIVGVGQKPSLSVGNVTNSTTLTSWTSTSIAKGSTWGIEVTACSAATNAVLQIYGFR